MERWKAVRAVLDLPGSKPGGSLAHLGLHLPDVATVDVPRLKLALAAELSRDVAARCGARLHAACVVVPSTSADARRIVATYRAALLAPRAFHDPRAVYFKLLQDFTADDERGAAANSWRLDDVLWVASIASVTDKGVESTAGLLRHSIQRLTKNVVNQSRLITKDLLMKALADSSMLSNFRSQMILQLTDDEHLKLLYREEEKALQAFLNQSNKVIGTKRRLFFKRRTAHKVLAAWRMDVWLALRANRRRKKEAWSSWHLVAQRIRLARRLERISSMRYYTSLRRRCLRKLVKHAQNRKKIKNCYTSDAEKDLRAGAGHLRIWSRKIRARTAVLRWEAYYLTEENLTLAETYRRQKVVRRVYRGWNDHAMGEVKSRKAKRSASIQQRELLKYLKDGNQAPIEATPPPAESLLAKQKLSQQREDARRRRQRDRQEAGADIRMQQRAQRRQRVETDRRDREEHFRSSWTAKKATAEAACLEQNQSWLLGSEFKNQSQKRQKEMQKMLSIKQASTMGARENVITCAAAIQYSILDAKMAEAGVVPDDLFRSLERIASPINEVPFRSTLVSCGLVLSQDEFRDIFEGLAKYKKEKATDASISYGDLQALRRMADKYIGQEGTRWKMYVCAVHQQLLAHNVFQAQKMYEKFKKKLIKQIVSESMQDHRLLLARRAHSEDRLRAHRTMLERHAARSIQSMYFQWRGRRYIAERRWILERKNLFQTRAKQAAAVLLIQRRYRAARR